MEFQTKILMLFSLFSLVVCALKGDPPPYPMPLDHFEAKIPKKYYQHRFKIDFNYFDENATEHQFIFQLSDQHPIEDYPFEDSVVRLAEITHAALISVEHRYFGSSVPYPIGGKPTYLTVDQVLADVIEIINSYKVKYDNMKVIAVGTGYAGALAAWLRVQYPQYVSGAWASYPEMVISEADTEYDQRVIERFLQHDKNCYKSFRTHMNFINSIIDNPDNQTRVYDLFGFNINQTNVTSALYVIPEVLGNTVLQNNNDKLISSFCDSDQELEDLAKTFKMTLDEYKINNPSILDPFNINPLNNEIGNQWRMKCYELFNFHVPSNQGETFFRSNLINLTFYNEACRHIFNVSKYGDFEQFNLRFGGKDPEGSKILYVLDPLALSYHKMPSPSTDNNNYVENCSNGIPGADLKRQTPGESEEYTQMRERCINRVVGWMTNSCSKTCQHGTCYQDHCICDEDYTGENCDKREIKYFSFKILSGAATGISTFLLFMSFIVAWRVIIRESETIGSKFLIF